MNTQTKRYLIFFILAFLFLRLPEMVGPQITKYAINKIITIANNNSIEVHIHKIEDISFGSFLAQRILIKNKLNNKNYLIDNLKLEITSYLNPSIYIEGKMYDGMLNCAINSESLIALVSNNINTQCDIKHLNLQSLPETGAYNILGYLDLSIESKLNKNIQDATSKAEAKVSKGYMDIGTLIGTSLVKMPPFVNVDLFAELELKPQFEIEIKNGSMKSNYGFVKSKGNIKFSNISLPPNISLEGNFDLEKDGVENLAPWVPLINNGQNLKGNTGSFKANGVPPRMQFQIAD